MLHHNLLRLDGEPDDNETLAGRVLRACNRRWMRRLCLLALPAWVTVHALCLNPWWSLPAVLVLVAVISLLPLCERTRR